MAFPVNLSNANLPKRLNLLCSKGDFVGKSGRIALNSRHTKGARHECPSMRTKGSAEELEKRQTLGGWAPSVAGYGPWGFQRPQMVNGFRSQRRQTVGRLLAILHRLAAVATFTMATTQNLNWVGWHRSGAAQMGGRLS